jgi:adenylate kinase
VLCFVVPEDVVVDRMLSRGRADDTEDVIRNRLAVYRSETEPLLDYYDGTVVTVDGVGDVGEVNRRALDALGAGDTPLTAAGEA